MGTVLSSARADEIRSEWLAALNGLYGQITTWAVDEGWEVEINDTETSEEALGRYHVPVMQILTPTGRLVMEPTARFVVGGLGTVELYAWPSLFRVRLIRKPDNDGWE